MDGLIIQPGLKKEQRPVDERQLHADEGLRGDGQRVVLNLKEAQLVR